MAIFESSCSGELEAESKCEMFQVQDKQRGQHVRTVRGKSELGVIIISQVKVHASCFQNKNYKIKPTLLLSCPASSFLEHFCRCLSPF